MGDIPARSVATSDKVGSAPIRERARSAIEAMVRKIVAEYAPSKIVLFGSHASGTAGPDSDIDLLIVKETQERFLDRWTLVQGILTGMHGSFPVDTLVVTPQEIERRLDLGDQFLADILENGEVLYVE